MYRYHSQWARETLFEQRRARIPSVFVSFFVSDGWCSLSLSLSLVRYYERLSVYPKNRKRGKLMVGAGG
jgi:hypothetical protein